MSETKSQKFFRIHITPHLKPQQTIRASLNSDMQIVGSESKVLVSYPNQQIPNYYTRHCVRILDSTGLYTGKLKFVKGFNDRKEGEQVELVDIRYIENCPSLDLRWQDENKFAPKDSRAYIGWLLPADSVQEYNLDLADPLFIEFLKQAQFNGSNKDRDNRNSVIFFEVDNDVNISNKKEKLLLEKRKIEFIENIHNQDSIVNIYAKILRVGSHYEPIVKKDLVLDKIEELSVAKFIGELDGIKTNYTNAINKWISNKNLEFKEGKFYLEKNPDNIFKSCEIKSKGQLKAVEELVDSILTIDTLYAEFEDVSKLLNK